jgi:Zn-dependent protease with chaperone function
MNTINYYPQSPQNVDKALTSPNKEYVQQVSKVFFSILLFMSIYLALLGISGALLYYGVIAAVFIIATKPSFITLTAGAGIVGLAVMFAWFMVKFIFKTRKNENPQRIQVFEKDHPQLFAFIRQLAKETGSPFPKKIFISPDVNACVFYNSSFLSLFLPVPKNLEIGLGLVNSVNMSEFKAVIAHEFGHFSQKSMKLGSYIYTVNHMLYNLVYEYDSWDHTLEKWANIGGVFGFFAVVTFKMISVVRFILGKAYNFINLFYMSLSRAMEYHADLVAVSVSGSLPMKNALRRLELSAIAYEFCMNHLQTLAEKEKYTQNIYLNHQAAIAHLCTENSIKKAGHLPVIEDKDMLKYAGKSRLRIKDQWASHPSMEEREANIERFPAEVRVQEDSPWLLFDKAEALQETMSRHMYALLLPDKTDVLPESPLYIQKLMDEDIAASKLDNRYNGYYNSRSIEYFDVDQTVAGISESQVHFTTEAQLFSDKVVKNIEQLHSNTHDLQVLRKIVSGHTGATFFEFDNIKYTSKDARQISYNLDSEVTEQQKWLCNQDKQVFSYYYRRASANGPAAAREYAAAFTDYFAIQAEQKKYVDLQHRMQLVQYQLYTKARWTEEEQRNLVSEIGSLHMLYEKYLREANHFTISIPCPETGESRSFRESILQEPVVPISSATFDFEKLRDFIGQLSGVVGKVVKINNDCFRKILVLQTSLSPAARETFVREIAG